jgi:hypothetical protein
MAGSGVSIDRGLAVTDWIRRTRSAMNAGSRGPMLTSIQAAPLSSWLRASSRRPARSFSSKSFFVEGTESLMDSPMIVSPGMAMVAFLLPGKIAPVAPLVNDRMPAAA